MKYMNGRAIVVIAVLLGSLFWAIVIKNFIDEPLRPEVRRAMEWQLPPAAYDDNAYLILLGMNEPAEHDAMDTGKRVLENELLQYKSYLKNHTASSPPVPSGTFSMKESLCDYQRQKNCVEYYLAQDSNVRQQLIEKNQFLLDRYRAMQKSRNYVESIPPYIHALLPSFSNVMNAAKLEHVLVISEITQHQYDLAVQRLVENALFSRKLLRNSDTLISHIIALAMIKNDMYIVSELLQKYPQLVQYSEQFAEILAPISTKEYSIAKTFEWERKHSLNSMVLLRHDLANNLEKEKKGYMNRVISFLYNENATMNLAYDLYGERIKVATAEAYQLDDAVDKAEVGKRKLYGSSIAELIYLNNSAGKIFLRVAEPDFTVYVERQHDMEGYVRLVALQYKIIAESIKAENIPDFLKKSGREYANPYTLEPMQWDSEKLELSFEGHQADKRDSSVRVLYTVKLPRIDRKTH